MSRILSGILSTVAVSATFGAIQFASGSDLIKQGQDVSSVAASQVAERAAESGINRAAKSDRADLAATKSGKGETISVRLDSLAATSVLIRLPAKFAEEVRNRPALPVLAKEPVTIRKSTVACEPVVSVLTEVAKQLQPGRCVT